MICLRFDAGQIAGLEQGLALAARTRGFSMGDGGIPVSVGRCPKGLRLEGRKGQYSLYYGERVSFFRGIALLVGNLEQGKTEFSYTQSPSLNLCGGMLDCSRNAVANTRTVLDHLAFSALMGLNCVMLYTEDTYTVEGYPYFGYMRGRYTPEELKTFDDAAHSLGIELIPCIQTLAHLKTTLRWEYAAKMKDDSDVLLIGEEQTYAFIEAMLKSLRPCFRSNRIHIGMDEAEGVGRGKYMNKHGYRDRFEILSEHLNKVCGLAEKYGFRPMMWSDMFFKLGSKKHIYYDPDAAFPENITQMIPANVDMVYWDYYSTDAERYKAMIRSHEKLGRPLVFAGAVYKWQGLAPNHTMTFAVTHPALQACRELGVKEVFATMWGDDGGEVSQDTMLLGMQLFAEYNYKDTVTREDLMDTFRLCTGFSGEDQWKLAIDDLDDTDIYSMRASLSKQILYMDVLQGLLDKHFREWDLGSFYDKKLAELETLEPCPRLEKLYAYYRTLTPILKKKWNLGIRVRDAYKARDKEALTDCARVCEELLSLYEAFHAAAYDLWMEENKPFGFDRVDLRLGGVMRRIRTAKSRLEAYCRGELPRLEELEEEVLYLEPSRAGKLPFGRLFKTVSTVSAEWG